METFGIAILVVVLIVSPIIIILVRNAAATIQLYAINLAHKAKELKREKRKSDSLLFQMLPPTVATQLKQAQTVPAEYYSAVTIFFSDIVGFTEIAAECTPLEVRNRSDRIAWMPFSCGHCGVPDINPKISLAVFLGHSFFR